MDRRLNNEYCIVKQKDTGDIVLSMFFESARIETLQDVYYNKDINKIPENLIPIVDTISEKGVNDLFIFNSKINIIDKEMKIKYIKNATIQQDEIKEKWNNK